MKVNHGNFVAVPDQSGTARSTSYRQTRSHGVLHTASGSRASGLPFQSGRKNSAASDAMDRGLLFISNTVNTYPTKWFGPLCHKLLWVQSRICCLWIVFPSFAVFYRDLHSVIWTKKFLQKVKALPTWGRIYHMKDLPWLFLRVNLIKSK